MVDITNTYRETEVEVTKGSQIRNDYLKQLSKQYSPQAIMSKSNRNYKQKRGFEERQKQAFKLYFNKYFNTDEDWLELFDMFFKDLIAGKVENMVDWLSAYTKIDSPTGQVVELVNEAKRLIE